MKRWNYLVINLDVLWIFKLLLLERLEETHTAVFHGKQYPIITFTFSCSVLFSVVISVTVWCWRSSHIHWIHLTYLWSQNIVAISFLLENICLNLTGLPEDSLAILSHCLDYLPFNISILHSCLIICHSLFQENPSILVKIKWCIFCWDLWLSGRIFGS